MEADQLRDELETWLRERGLRAFITDADDSAPEGTLFVLYVGGELEGSLTPAAPVAE